MGLVFGTALPSASAQLGDAYQKSTDFYRLTVSSSSLTVLYLASESGPYTSGVRPVAVGAAVNQDELDQEPNEYNEAENYSFCNGGPGYAYQFHGIRYVIQLHNTGRQNQSFRVVEQLEEYNEDEGVATSASYGGFRETGGRNLSGSDTLTIAFDGEAFDDPVNMASAFTWYEDGSYTDASVRATGQWSDTLTPGQSVVITVWAAGRTAVNHPRRLGP
jgi:hypothetical protein